jgi:hypothetical protein
MLCCDTFTDSDLILRVLFYLELIFALGEQLGSGFSLLQVNIPSTLFIKEDGCFVHTHPPRQDCLLQFTWCGMGAACFFFFFCGTGV